MRTLSVDCGGTGLKCLVLDEVGEPLCERVRVPTPYPCPPEVLVAAVMEIAAATGVAYDRASVGFPGLIRQGIVRATPHYVTEAGPFTPARADLVAAWTRFDVRNALEGAFGVPTRVVNDAEIAGLAVIDGLGFEVMLTLGTGVGFATFDDGRVLPKVELSQARYRKRRTYDSWLGAHARTAVGNEAWAREVARAVRGLRPVLWWDHLFVGGGSTKHLIRLGTNLGDDVTLVPNTVGLLGGIRLWTAGAGTPH